MIRRAYQDTHLRQTGQVGDLPTTTMLSENAKLLLSASIDGVLSSKERSAVERLLRDSAEARGFVQKLQANVASLRNLPRVSLGQDFSTQVMAMIPMAVVTQPEITQPANDELAFPIPQRRLRRGLPAWAVGGIAASVVGVAVLGGLAWVRSQLDIDRDLLPSSPVQTPVVRTKTPPVRSDVVDQLVLQVVRGSGERYGEVKPEPFVAPSSQTPEPVRFVFGDLKNQKSFDHLKWELSQVTDIHLDVTVKYNARSLNRIIESFHKQGVQLVVTAPAEASVQKKQPLLVYAENVQADKLALALRELSEIDVQGKTKQASTFEALRVSPGSAADHKRIGQALGINPLQLKTPATPVPQVSALGVVLPVDAINNPMAVREISGFLAARGPVQIGTLQVFLHLEPLDK